MIKMNGEDAYTSTEAYGGIACVPGVAIGHAVVVYPPANLDAIPLRETDNPQEQISLLEEAIEKTRQELIRLQTRLTKHVGREELILFDAYLRMLDKLNLAGEIIAEIQKGQWAPGALKIVIKRHIQFFAAMEDDYLKERAADVEQLGLQVLAHLQQKDNLKEEYAEKTILAGTHISAAHIAEVPDGKLVALVCATGSMNSHVAIIARAMGIPTVLSVEGINWENLDKTLMIVDGYYGQVYLAPPVELITEFKELIYQEEKLNANLQTLRDLPATTTDNHQIELKVNIGLTLDAALPLSIGASGVGLFRTELPFMIRDRFPTEEEQRILYRQLLAAFSPRSVVMRTLDIGGDKMLPYFPIHEENPYLGWRGIRVTLDHPEVFLVQIRAMLRASEGYNNLSILLPMISSISELDESIYYIERVYSELQAEGVKISKPRVGIMIEVPATLFQVPDLVKRVDFLSVGSNDLIQYLLAADRNNAHVTNLYDGLHPAVLRALQQVVKSAQAHNTPISICGEMASDPAAAILLLAMGFDSLSMNSGSLLKIKWLIRNFSMQEAKALLAEVINYEHAAFVRLRLEDVLESKGLENLIRVGNK